MNKSTKKAKGGKGKHTYNDMVITALLTLNERGGSSRQAIWKCVEAKFPEADYKQYIVRLKKLAENPASHIVRVNSATFKLSQSFKEKAKRRMEKGETIHKVVATKASTHENQAARKKMKNTARKQKEKETKMTKKQKAKEKAAAKKAKEAEKKAKAKARKSA